MSVHRVDVDHISMKFERPYPAGKKRIKERHLLILRVYEEEWIGIGEVTLPLEDFYNQEAETVVETAWQELTESVLDRFFHFPEENFEEDLTALSKIDAAPALLCGLESALWDLEGQKRNQPLHKMLGARQTVVLAGLETHPEARADIVVSQLDRYLKSDGYRRVKVTIHPNNPFELLKVLRKNLPPNLKIAADAGGRFKPAEINVLSKMEDYHLDFLQDPFPLDTADEVYDELNEMLPNTPICLGKQFKDAEALRQAADKELCQVACLIPSRLGGIQVTRQLARWMQQEGFSAWMGSDCETGIGTTAGLHLACLAAFDEPADSPPSFRWFEDELIRPWVKIRSGEFALGNNPGLGISLSEKTLRKHSLKSESFFRRDFRRKRKKLKKDGSP